VRSVEKSGFAIPLVVDFLIVAAPEQTLEALVRDELRGPVSELVRRLVPSLGAEALNGSGRRRGTELRI
jgi:hypothetical protein